MFQSHPTTLGPRPLAARILGFALLFALAACAGEAPPSEPPEPEPPALRPAGYLARACGFDLDDDGVVGEPEDDCRICDGKTPDPDGDGVAEDLIYVDCQTGADTPECGSPEAPCASLAHAWAEIADGPGDGAEDVVCFRGTCPAEELDPGVGGLGGTWETPAEESGARAWPISKDPAMLVGWDGDGDGAYPPFDGDDTAVLDGRGRTRALAFGPETDHFEAAHFEAHDYGVGTRGNDTGFVRFGPMGRDLDHLYFHDLELERINRQRKPRSAVSVVNLFTGGARLHWLRFENLRVSENGGWFARGAGPHGGPGGDDDEEEEEEEEEEEPAAEEPEPSPGAPAAEATQPLDADVGPWRFRHITRTALGCDFDECGSSAASTVFKIWGYVSGVEILDSAWDANVAAWQPKPQGGPHGSSFAYVAQCSRDWSIRGNEILDYKSVLRVDGHSPKYCTGSEARPVDDVVFAGNRVVNTYEPWAFGDIPVRIGMGGDDVGEVVGDVEIRDNVFASPVGWEACLWVEGGNGAAAPEGEIVIAENVCYGPVTRHGAIVVGNVEGEEATYPHQKIRLERNVVAGVGRGQPNVATTYAPEEWSAAENVYDPEGDFRWAGDDLPSLRLWREATGGDRDSIQCLPDFADPEAGDYSLARDSACTPGAELPDEEL